MEDAKGYWLARLLLQRGIGVICFVAFVAALNQFRPLLGERGLLPVPEFVKQVPFRESPSLFYLFPRDGAFIVVAWAGIFLSLLVIGGIPERFGSIASAVVWALIYILYLSFVNVGQVFYAFGWESLLLEACFFAMFLGGSRILPQSIPIWLFRWLLFRIMFGAGLIKLRGDSCWRDLTCLNYYYETQPMPNPLSWFFHWQPEWMHKGGVLFNHFAELIVPFFYFAPQPIAGIAGIITILFQGSIILSGNLSWLNWLTLVLAFSTIDGRFLSLMNPAFQASTRFAEWSSIALAAIVAVMSIPPVMNMISPRQMMNASYNPLHLVGTYGAFGSITRPRYEVVVEGTAATDASAADDWKEYEFKAKPGDLARLPRQFAPYHLRLDWLMWFAAMSSYREESWFVPFVEKLLVGDSDTLSLIRSNPFPNQPPKFIRARLFEYHFTTPEQRKKTGDWWTRTYTGEYLPPVSLRK